MVILWSYIVLVIQSGDFSFLKCTDTMIISFSVVEFYKVFTVKHMNNKSISKRKTIF
jgi:hypothetical protein